MCSLVRNALCAATALLLVGIGTPSARSNAGPARGQVLEAMKRATTFMVDTVSTKGGYVWSYLPDRSRRWGELEARDTMIWIQPPGTATMGHLFLDAYHATGDEYYYTAAGHAAGALIQAQLPSGGWNYLADLSGDRSLREWYDTVGRNAWRLEEFQHLWGNGTFDDAGTAESARLLLRMYVEKHDSKFRPALDKAIRFVLDSQYPNGGWPQRFPLQRDGSLHGAPDYTSYITFNDDVASENIDFLILCHQALGDTRVLDPIRRGMNAFVVMQQPPPQPGWGLQHTLDGKPIGARTYEPTALVTHTTAANLALLVKFYRLTGETTFLSRIPEAIAWLDALTLPPGIAPPGRTHPTFVEVGTNRPLYVHRSGSNVFNGRYYVDHDPKNTIGHYSSFRTVDVAGLRRAYEEARALPPDEARRASPLAAKPGTTPLRKYFAAADQDQSEPVERVIAALRPDGAWIVPLGTNSHPYRGDGSTTVTPGDFSRTMVGDATDTSPYPDAAIVGISTAAYVRNMSALIRFLDRKQPPATAGGIER